MNDRKEPEATSSTDVESSQAAAAVSRVPEPVAPKEALIEESCILKIFHMSLRSYNCLKQFLGFPKHYLILEIFICVNEESQRARA